MVTLSVDCQEGPKCLIQQKVVRNKWEWWRERENWKKWMQHSQVVNANSTKSRPSASLRSLIDAVLEIVFSSGPDKCLDKLWFDWTMTNFDWTPWNTCFCPISFGLFIYIYCWTLFSKPIMYSHAQPWSSKTNTPTQRKVAWDTEAIGMKTRNCSFLLSLHCKKTVNWTLSDSQIKADVTDLTNVLHCCRIFGIPD